MSLIVECSKDETKNKNTGANEQCLEGMVIRHALAIDAQEFSTAADAKSLAKWKEQVNLKQIIPLFEIEELAAADTEDTYFEGRVKKYRTATGKKVRTFNCFLGLCSHNALKSYSGREMRIYEFTETQEIKGVTPDGVKVKGQLVTIEVGKRVDAMKDKPAHTPVTLTYSDYNDFEDNGVVLKPTWSHLEVQGIFDVDITLVSASATSIKFKVDAGCAGEVVKSLTDSDITLKTALGAPVIHTFVPADSSGVYQLTGTGFVNGLILGLDGVVAQTEASYEAVDTLVISGI
jgi:hypothetical protein